MDDSDHSEPAPPRCTRAAGSVASFRRALTWPPPPRRRRRLEAVRIAAAGAAPQLAVFLHVGSAAPCRSAAAAGIHRSASFVFSAAARCASRRLRRLSNVPPQTGTDRPAAVRSVSFIRVSHAASRRRYGLSSANHSVTFAVPPAWLLTASTRMPALFALLNTGMSGSLYSSDSLTNQRT
jgi:hypothetical protein